MITSTARNHWPGDIIVTDLAAAGLPIASVIRIEKITTLETGLAAQIGRLGNNDLVALRRWLEGVFES
jgi:hypothetical protein